MGRSRQLRRRTGDGMVAVYRPPPHALPDARGLMIPARLLSLLPLLLTVLAAIPVPGLADVRDESVLETDSLSSQVDALFRGWHRPDSPGAAVLVMRNGEIVHMKGYGMANLEHGVPIRPGTVFDIASVSKQFAGMAIAMLVQEGKLSMEDDVRLYIPELPEFGDPIRIRHLVHHTSGIRDWPGTLGMAGWDYMDVISFEQILQMAFHQRELNFPPGAEYAYSNTGYNLLAELVSRVTGTSFRDWTREHIFEPLGMHASHFHDDHTEVVPHRAESYRPSANGEFRRVVSSLTALGSSSLFTTVEDLARWIANFDDPIVGGPDVVEQMHQPGVLNGGDTISYAYGVGIDEHRGATTVSHGGSWAGYRSTLLRFPEHALSIVILANVSDLGPGPLGYRVAEIYLGEIFEPATERGEHASDPGLPGREIPAYRPSVEALHEYVGEYHSVEIRTSYRLRVEGDELVAEHFRTGRRSLQPVEEDVFEAPGFGRIEFLRDDDGRITAFTANSTRIRGLRFEQMRQGGHL